MLVIFAIDLPASFHSLLSADHEVDEIVAIGRLFDGVHDFDKSIRQRKCPPQTRVTVWMTAERTQVSCSTIYRDTDRPAP
jgi:hypothetical protein